MSTLPPKYYNLILIHKLDLSHQNTTIQYPLVQKVIDFSSFQISDSPFQKLVVPSNTKFIMSKNSTTSKQPPHKKAQQNFVTPTVDPPNFPVTSSKIIHQTSVPTSKQSNSKSSEQIIHHSNSVS